MILLLDTFIELKLINKHILALLISEGQPKHISEFISCLMTIPASYLTNVPVKVNSWSWKTTQKPLNVSSVNGTRVISTASSLRFVGIKSTNGKERKQISHHWLMQLHLSTVLTTGFFLGEILHFDGSFGFPAKTGSYNSLRHTHRKVIGCTQWVLVVPFQLQLQFLQKRKMPSARKFFPLGLGP